MSAPDCSLLDAVARRLIPLFRDPGTDREAARRAALAALAAFNPQTLVDPLVIGRILALTLAAIAATAEAIDPAHPPSRQIQFMGKANTLSRSAQQAEAALAKSRQQSHSQAELRQIPQAKPDPRAEPRPTPQVEPVKPRPAPMPVTAPSPDAAIQTLIEQAMAEFSAAVPPHLLGNQRKPSLRQALMQGTSSLAYAASASPAPNLGTSLRITNK